MFNKIKENKKLRTFIKELERELEKQKEIHLKMIEKAQAMVDEEREQFYELRSQHFRNTIDLDAKKKEIKFLKSENEKLASQLIDAINISLMEEKINENKALTDNELKLWKIIYNKAYKKGYMNGYEKRIEDGWEDIEDDDDYGE